MNLVFLFDVAIDLQDLGDKHTFTFYPGKLISMLYNPRSQVISATRIRTIIIHTHNVENRGHVY